VNKLHARSGESHSDVTLRVARGLGEARGPPPDHGGPAAPIIAKEISRGRAIID
jgi:hypothetical protein